ncbi:MAG TPA: lipid-A-disaccharide synthase [Sedimenticola thiotaurini]|uniref:Lipid-A-disaccharide synthase n=1 Tax=Sedimenticola thiotaurini TaxID=1543721 RepID=A0A831RJW9_9GAMM|nr:lipid-A-disaccharide synthase [Sedimenticola thiotaurini]
MLKIGIVANEPSGDLLGAGLMRALRQQRPEVVFQGVGGPMMIREGLHSLYPMERLSVMGLSEVLRHLPGLLAIRRDLKRRFLSAPPDVFIGIDAPDFNLGLEQGLKRGGIPTVHYVSPTVWAWRPKRVKKIRRAVDLMLSIFPFEQQFLQRHRVPVAYVGHPLADQIPLEVDPDAARVRLGIAPDARIVALLPGSRVSEIDALAARFLQAAMRVRRARPETGFLVPLVNRRTREAFEAIRREVAPDLPLRLIEGGARDVMLASDLVLTASGTATLEALLLERPMVVAYRVSPLTHWLVTRLNLIRTPYIAMANLLAGEQIAPELIQDQATPEALADALLELMEAPRRVERIREVCRRVHRQLRRDASREAATAVLELVDRRRTAGDD